MKFLLFSEEFVYLLVSVNLMTSLLWMKLFLFILYCNWHSGNDIYYEIIDDRTCSWTTYLTKIDVFSKLTWDFISKTSSTHLCVCVFVKGRVNTIRIFHANDDSLGKLIETSNCFCWWGQRFYQIDGSRNQLSRHQFCIIINALKKQFHVVKSFIYTLIWIWWPSMSLETDTYQFDDNWQADGKNGVVNNNLPSWMK